MKEARDMVGISVPFVAGVACAALLRRPEYSVNVLVLIAPLLLFLADRERSSVFCAILFWLCGVFVFSSHSLCVIPGQPGAVRLFCNRALIHLQQLIESIPFSDKETSSLVKVLLSGDRSGMTKETVDAFRNAGASHILALSGLHLGMLYAIVSTLLSVLGNSPLAMRVRGLASVTICAFYTLMTGAGPSIVRAFIFICLNEIARNSPEREKNLLRELLAASLIQLSISPDSITSLSFQLSYLAMLGIALLHPLLRSFYPDTSGSIGFVKRVWDAASLSVSCQAFTAPLCWMRFHTFPRYFLLTNLLALPLTSVVMILAIMCVTLTYADICPHCIVSACEGVIRLLVSVLGTISAM